MTEHSWERDEWPTIFKRVTASDILVIAGPIWLGDNSSVTKQIIERLYACSHLLNEAGQHAYYGRVGGCLITGNEDGVKHNRGAAGRGVDHFEGRSTLRTLVFRFLVNTDKNRAGPEWLPIDDGRPEQRKRGRSPLPSRYDAGVVPGVGRRRRPDRP